MTIQLSVTLWTIICFCLAMLILWNLLFKPVLNLMDARKEKIKAARGRKEEYEKHCLELKRLEEEKKALLQEKKQKLIKEELERIKAENKIALEKAKDRRLQKVEEFRKNSETDHTQMLQFLSEHSENIAVLFAESLTKE